LARLTLKVVMQYDGDFVRVTVLQVAKISRCTVHAVLLVFDLTTMVGTAGAKNPPLQRRAL
jgi:hypothetical protein